MQATIRDRVKELRRVPASELVPNPKNWRKHPKAQKSALRAAIDEIGFSDVLIAREDANGKLLLIDGHLRRDITGDQIVPVIVTDLDEAEADKLLAVLDPLAGMAEIDHDAIGALAASMDFESPDLQRVLEGLLPPTEAAQDQAPSLDEAPPRATAGDVWACGRHRVACGDACDEAAVAALLGDARPNLTVTDPPYGVEYDPAWRQRAAEMGHLAFPATRVGEVTADDRVDWTAALSLVPGPVIYCWHGAVHASRVQESIEAAGFIVRSQLIWSKPHLPISRGHYHWQHEPCWYAVRKGKTARWIGDRKQRTIWEITLDENVVGGHSTQKPVECMARPIRNHEGDVYDPFVGSGTTMIAAEQVGRACYAMEIAPRYVDVVLERWERFTGGKAVKVS